MPRTGPCGSKSLVQIRSGVPVGEIPIDRSPVDALREALRDFPFGDETATLVENAYAPGRTFGSAFFHLLRQVLSSQDLLFLDPMHPASRRLAAPLLREAIEAAPDLTARVLDRNRELTEAGYHAQVYLDEHTSLVFLLEDGRRLTLHRQNGEYSINGRRFSTGDLAARAEQLSPNALLRPVVQDYMLPTVAYVGGPAELAYLAQSQVIYVRCCAACRLPFTARARRCSTRGRPSSWGATGFPCPISSRERR